MQERIVASEYSKTDPVHQFHLETVYEFELIPGWLDFTITNATLYMFLAVAVVILGGIFLTMRVNVVPGRKQNIAELSYEFIAGMIKNINGVEGLRFFPLIFTLFFFILVANLLGMVPMFYTTTSLIMVNAVLALLVMGIVIGFGLYKNGLKFFSIFAPSGLPVMLYPLIILIEIISFISRPLSLSVRLFANMLAGHIALKVFAGFIASLLVGGLSFAAVLTVPVFLMTLAITGLEVLVAFLQAFVFALLTCVYLNDALHPGH